MRLKISKKLPHEPPDIKAMLCAVIPWGLLINISAVLGILGLLLQWFGIYILISNQKIEYSHDKKGSDNETNRYF